MSSDFDLLIPSYFHHSRIISLFFYSQIHHLGSQFSLNDIFYSDFADWPMYCFHLEPMGQDDLPLSLLLRIHKMDSLLNALPLSFASWYHSHAMLMTACPHLPYGVALSGALGIVAVLMQPN